MNKRLYFAQYVGFVSLGGISCMIGPLLPTVRNALGISLEQAGILLSGQFMGMLPTVLIGGYLADRLGKKTFLLLGSVLLFAGLIGSMLADGFSLLLPFIFLTGIGAGTYEIGINSLCADTNEINRGKAMNFLHFFFGIGAIASPVLVTICITALNRWRLSFGISAALPVIVAIILLPVGIPRQSGGKTENSGGKTPYRDGLLWMVGGSAFFYVGVETSIYGWCSVFWSDRYVNDVIPASILSTVFWLSLTIGRLICGKIADRVGFSKYIIGTSFLTMLSVLVWYLFPYRIVTMLVTLTSGLILAGIYPTMLASVNTCFPGDSGRVTAFITAFTSLGGFLVPMVIGRIADRFQIAVLPAVILSMSVLLVILTFVTWNVVLKQRTKTLKEAEINS